MDIIWHRVAENLNIWKWAMQWTKSQRNIEKNRVFKPERVQVADQYGEEDPCELPKLGTCKQPAIQK